MGTDQRNIVIANLKAYHIPLMESLGIKEFFYLPKLFYKAHGVNGDVFVSLFPGELKEGRDVYMEKVSKDYIPEDTQRTLFVWKYRDYSHYDRTQDSNESQRRYLIPESDLIKVIDLVDTSQIKSDYNFEDSDKILRQSIKDGTTDIPNMIVNGIKKNNQNDHIVKSDFSFEEGGIDLPKSKFNEKSQKWEDINKNGETFPTIKQSNEKEEWITIQVLEGSVVISPLNTLTEGISMLINKYSKEANEDYLLAHYLWHQVQTYNNVIKPNTKLNLE